jgi:hypothetical protein
MSPSARSPYPATTVEDITEQRTQTLRDAHQSIVSSRVRSDPIVGWHRARRSFGRPRPDSDRTGPTWRQARQWRRTELPREHRKTPGQSLETKSDGALRIEPPVRKFNRRRMEEPDPACDGHPSGAKHTGVARWWMLRNGKLNILASVPECARGTLFPLARSGNHDTAPGTRAWKSRNSSPGNCPPRSPQSRAEPAFRAVEHTSAWARPSTSGHG